MKKKKLKKKIKALKHLNRKLIHETTELTEQYMNMYEDLDSLRRDVHDRLTYEAWGHIDQRLLTLESQAVWSAGKNVVIEEPTDSSLGEGAVFDDHMIGPMND